MCQFSVAIYLTTGWVSLLAPLYGEHVRVVAVALGQAGRVLGHARWVCCTARLNPDIHNINRGSTRGRWALVADGAPMRTTVSLRKCAPPVNESEPRRQGRSGQEFLLVRSYVKSLANSRCEVAFGDCGAIADV